MLATSLTLPSGLVLPNRIAKASMTEALADRRGRPTKGHARLYRRWAEGGVGMQLTGNVMVDGRYLERPGNVILGAPAELVDEETRSQLTAWARAAKVSGAPVLMQLSHPGRQTQKMVVREPVAPSAVAAVKLFGSFGKPRALREDEILDVIERFAESAELAKQTGFDGVQIHAAHGYLANQFLSPLTNVRDDAWGGSLENRARFLLSIVRAVRARVGRDFTISVKLNSADFQRGGFDEDDALEVVRLLDVEGIDLLEISGGNYEAPALFGVDASQRTRTQAREAYFLAFARRVRGVSKVPLMVTGGFRSRAVMESALAEGALDVVGLARPLALEPDLPRLLLEGKIERAAAPSPARPFIAALAALAEGAWFWRQLQRMSEGRAPSPRLSIYYSMLAYMLGDFLRAMRREKLVVESSRPNPLQAPRPRKEATAA